MIRFLDEVNATARNTSDSINTVADKTNEMAGKISDIEIDAQNSESIAVVLNGEVNKFKL